ncbi:MAG: nitroreductase family deazaflavin-dependent oxidoreductase [Chloroflexi bacterium]|nr:nitroreductase family deazaflavin-dependent oxidoreductase [Chloroflexota bacterium]
MSDATANSWEDNLIADLRANGGRASSGPLAGEALLVLYTTGARTGLPRRAVLSVTRDGEDYVVAGTAGGRPSNPSWFANLQANPTVRFEADGQTFTGTATVAEGADRDRLWGAHVAVLPRFAAYPEQAGRIIPMVRLRPQA